MTKVGRVAACAAVVLCTMAATGAQGAGDPAVMYRVTFPEVAHHVADVEATFTGLGGGPLRAVMSRSSAGRYALHEFAKNVYDVRAADPSGRELAIVRPSPYEWDVPAHGDAVRITYKVFGDLVDGTYLAVDSTHAHMNMPATFMWALGLEDRPMRVTFVPPAGSKWKPATQLYPTSDPWTFTAPNLEYFFDSPTELSDYALRQFTVRNPDGKTFTIRAAVHTDATPAEIDTYAAGLEQIVNEEATVYGEVPEYEPGIYTFIADYLPYDGSDGMEHRNSTIVTSGRGLPSALSTASHEFFHCWNVRRIRPQGLEPFDFERANMTDSLWVAEGFTQYYGQLILARTGLAAVRNTIAGFGSMINAVVNDSGRRFRSPIEMSRMAPFVDAARSVDPTNFSTTFISYYTYGGAVALGLDLTLRERTNGRLTLDSFMREMWRVYGKPGGPAPGLVAKPYAVTDIRDRLADLTGDRAFAEEFYNKYMAGREVVDYAALLERAGVLLRKRAPGQGWAGDLRADSTGTRIGALVPPGTPAYEAGLDEDDQITSVDGKAVASLGDFEQIIEGHKPGDRVTVGYVRRSGPATATITLAENPALEAVIVEDAGGTPTPDQLAFRHTWLGSQRK
ncbi:MAG: M61 family metallopeptidase [Vicinamibacterales bacterium]